jgi:hypothetical protein
VRRADYQGVSMTSKKYNRDYYDKNKDSIKIKRWKSKQVAIIVPNIKRTGGDYPVSGKGEK